MQGLSQAFYSPSLCALILKLFFSVCVCVYVCMCSSCVSYVRMINYGLSTFWCNMMSLSSCELQTEPAACLTSTSFISPYSPLSFLVLGRPSAVVVRGLVVSSHFWLIEFHFETNRNFHFAQLSGVQTTVCCDTLCWDIFKIELLPSKCEFNLIKTVSTVA